MSGVRHPRRPSERVPVFCWCEAEVVQVTLRDVYLGLTGACRRKDCKARDRLERGQARAL